MTNSKTYSDDEIWALLAQIPDPEIPVITIEELGVLRKVEQINNEVIVTITPTYTGCPAMKVFEDDILSTLKENSIENGKIKVVNSPAWTTDWIPESAKEKLRKFGIAPPVDGSQDKGTLFASGPKIVPCPQCKSENTKLISQFGSTACKAHYQCNDCLEPFDYFKCI